MAKVEPRNVGPLIKIIRNFLLGREHTTHLRHQDFIAARTQPPPNLPDGPSHKLSANYYYSRDGRREVKLPTVLAIRYGRQEIAAGASGSKDVAVKKATTPGSVYRWD
ncbi:NADH dehydrogenase [ubiquinone] 1 alpha subcomplex subunit 7 [Ischnura elegans]|uniref:NADH dehydrogenase [ubiquinone] 1 alpha subcomplex subunit 7 n=1 Tax=Ischnura elegans TaxID=197161 RepID=UPI001ED87ECB|nr:NADH dehydrogenase [ubiquinone] 1 alpha subcomplex subunit 7 [Ischnura elegans]